MIQKECCIYFIHKYLFLYSATREFYDSAYEKKDYMTYKSISLSTCENSLNKHSSKTLQNY